MHGIWREIKYWSQALILPLYVLSFLVPRDNRLWAFGSTFGERFADNPKYFYLYISQMKSKEIKAIWISKKKDIVHMLRENELEAYYAYSIKGIWYSLRAGIYLFDNYSKDICFWLSGGAIKINLWHGIPLKKINLDNKFDLVRNPVSKRMKFKYALRRISDEKPSHYVLTTSSYFVPIFSSAFATKNVLCCGYPRNDILTSSKIQNVMTQEETASLNTLNSIKSSLENARIVLYMPTFRDSESEFFHRLDQKTLDAFLRRNNIIFCIKPHPKSKVKKAYSELESSHIVVIDAEADPYVFLKCADVLVTDYSSIYFDYLLLDQPIIFFCYDLDQYLLTSREMYFNYNEFTPGIKAYSMEELFGALSDITGLSSDAEMKNKRLTILQKTFDPGNERGCEKLYHMIQRDILNSNL